LLDIFIVKSQHYDP